MTEKLYYEDSRMRRFTARVAGCGKADGRYAVTLDRTAFFPEGGGQPADGGTLGGLPVLHVSEKDGEVFHWLPSPLPVGAEAEGVLDWDARWRAMQNHTGEHIVSGLVHGKYGYDNVGFHMGADGVIVDFSGYLTPEQLSDVELEANRVVQSDVPVTQSFPAPEELPHLEYRSKLELTENVRLVTIGGCDVCACCATHVSRTGEIGVVRILESIRRRDGVRIRMMSGLDALRELRGRARSVSKISALLSAKPEEAAQAVEKLLADKAKLEWEIGDLKRETVKRLTEELAPAGGNRVFFEPLFSGDDLRLLVNAAAPFCGGVCAAFSGSDGAGYAYVVGSVSKDVRAGAGELNAALSGRGGGTPEMIRGSVKATRAQIEAYFREKQF